MKNLINLIITAIILDFTLSFQCDSPIYCFGPVLQTIQLSGIFKDSKTFVDMPLKYQPGIVYSNFLELSNHSTETLKQFLQDNFYEAYSDVKIIEPKDFVQNPEFLRQIKQIELKNFAYEVNQIWKTLVKTFDHSFSCPECFSSILNEYPFVVPGGRFNEYYYWDNLWIVHGLLVSEMYQTALDVGKNIIANIQKYGYMPNGARIYYFSRSQPPVAAQIVNLLYENLKENINYKQQVEEFLDQALPALDKEYQFFMTQRKVKVGADIYLNRYNSNQTTPRPESYKEDIHLHDLYPERKESDLYINIGAGCESGMDFSTRWFQDKNNFGSIETSSVAPVDLNSFLYLNEKILQKLYSERGDENQEQYYRIQAFKRKNNFNSYFYNSQSSEWFDYWFENQKNSTNEFYASNYSPLLGFGNEIPTDILDKILDKLQYLIEKYPGGMPSSEFLSGQQWDLPNAWPPSQYIIIEGLWKLNQNQQAQKIAFQISQKYVNNAYCTWKIQQQKTGQGAMFEKYNAQVIGQQGGGGEYDVQVGFGWSNGVLLRIFQKYGQELLTPQCQQQILIK